MNCSAGVGGWGGGLPDGGSGRALQVLSSGMGIAFPQHCNPPPALPHPPQMTSIKTGQVT